MKNATVLVNENVSIENAHGLMKLIFERYQPEEIRELLDEIIYQYNWLLMEHLRDQGAAKGLIDEVKKMFTVYPNPFENEINVIHEFDDVSYSIFSLDGKEIQKGRLLNSKISINQLPSSVYLLKLQSEEKVQIIKMVKQ